MKLAQVVLLASTLAALATPTYGYELSSTARTMMSPIAGAELNNNTGLSTNQESRIYGGSEADLGQYPFIVSLRFEPDGKTFCGGTLVASQYILTAGHCIKTDKGQIYVSLGSEYGSGSGSASAEQIKVSAGFRHPLYYNDKHRYDVGLLKLETSSTQKPANLCAADGSDNEVGTLATVLGWGLTEDRKGSFTLQGVNVAIISNAECNKEYGNRITEEMVCAGNGDGKDSCNGDSGGPLVANGVLVGLVSWGGRCGAKAGVYTRLAYVMDYIVGVLNGDTDSIFPGRSPIPGSSKKDRLTPSPETESTEDPNATKTATMDTPAAEASTMASSVSSSKNEELTMALKAPTSTPNAPTSQLSTANVKMDALANEAPAPGKACALRRRFLSPNNFR
ncbi:hypothetical protein PRIC1_007288 [Phytophthora ramorum]|nr:Glucanase inhibitor protein 3 [Phytophthora ramorum]